MKYKIFLMLILLVPPGLAAREIIVAVAANVQFVMEELGKAFQAATAWDIKTVSGSSGKLTAQIRNGAPFDVFLSADMQYPDTLYAAGFAVTKPRVYAYGALVLWSMKALPLTDIESLFRDPGLRRIAIANPRLAPYGEEALRVLQYYRLYDRVKARLVYGRNVSQVNQYIVSGAVDVGLTAKSAVLAPQMQGKGVWVEIDSHAYAPIEQGVVILKHGQESDPEVSGAFYDFLFSAGARDIFQKYGYGLP